MNARNIVTFSILLSMLALTGCANVKPLARNAPLYSQDKLQAADHWDNVANTVAMRVQKSLEERRDLINKPLYVQPPNEKPFSIAFSNLLRTRLVSKGMQVLDRPEPGCIEIRYDVQTILHESSSEWMPSLASMGIGIANFVTGSYGYRSDHEIIINTSMVHNNRYAMHLSTVCYINDDEWPMYMNAGGLSTASGAPAGNQSGTGNPTWQHYATRKQAFADCPPETPRQPIAPKKRATTAKKKTTKPKAQAKKPLPTAPLFPEPFCPDGCIPAPKVSTAGTVEQARVSPAAPVTQSPITAGTPPLAAPVPAASTPPTTDAPAPATPPAGAVPATGTPTASPVGN